MAVRWVSSSRPSARNVSSGFSLGCGRAPRARSVVALGVLATLAVLAYVPLADAGSGWSMVCLAAVLVGTASIAWPLAPFTDARGVAVVR